VHRAAADRIDLRGAAARQHADVGVAADHGDLLGRGHQGQQALVVLQQHDAFLGVGAGDLGVGGVVDRGDLDRLFDHAAGEQAAQDAAGHVVQPGLETSPLARASFSGPGRRAACRRPRRPIPGRGRHWPALALEWVAPQSDIT
jgi:hypothetical protein